MSAQTSPRVSIGLPVFNGENAISAAIASILAQTFTDFELIISDNASTDGTKAICREYAALDARIRYHRNDRNLGAAANDRKRLRCYGHLLRWLIDYQNSKALACDVLWALDPRIVTALRALKRSRLARRSTASWAQASDQEVVD